MEKRRMAVLGTALLAAAAAGCVFRALGIGTAAVAPVEERFMAETAAAQAWDGPEPGELERGEVSAFVIDDSGFMGSGAYEAYLRDRSDEEEFAKRQKPQDPEEDQPMAYFDFLGMDETFGRMGKNPQDEELVRAFCSSMFYMEIPRSWYLGANGACPLIFCHQSERRENSGTGFGAKEYDDVFPPKIFAGIVSGYKEEITESVLGGGINEVLEKAVERPITDEYEITQDRPDDMWCTLKQGKKQIASFYVWENIGKVVIFNNDAQLCVKKTEDYGRVMAFLEWEDRDFSTPEAIRNYVKTGGADYLTKEVLGEDGSWTCSEYTTEYHDFLRFEGAFKGRHAAMYIPVTPEYNENWVLLFEASDETQVGDNAYDLQESMVNTFVLLPYDYEVKQGDTLDEIAKVYTGNPGNYVPIARFPTNNIKNPTRIHPGQRIEIPLNLLFEKIN